MAKNKITQRFFLYSCGFVLVATALAKLCQILYMIYSSDIMMSEAVVSIFHIGYELFNLFAVASTVTVSIYAYSYFGIKTAIKSSLLSLAALTLGKVIMYVYNVLVNTLTTAQLIAGALSYITEVLFDALVIVLALIFAFSFAKLRIKKGNDSFSPLFASFGALAVYFLILIADLTFMNVIPFFVKYGDPLDAEIRTIISDYLYYLISIPIAMLFSMLSNHLLTKVTGKLRLKSHYVNNESKELNQK